MRICLNPTLYLLRSLFINSCQVYVFKFLHISFIVILPPIELDIVLFFSDCGIFHFIFIDEYLDF